MGSPDEAAVAAPPMPGAEVPLDGGQEQVPGRHFYPGWYAVGLGTLMQILAAGPVYYAFGNYSVMLSAEYQAPKTMINLAYTLIVVVGAIGSAPVGWLADRWPVRRLCMIGVLSTAVGFVLIGLSTAMWQVVLLFGTFVAVGDIFLGNVVSNYLIAHWFERRRGLALGLSMLGASLAAIIFPPLTRTLFELAGWRETFVIYGAMTLALAVPVLAFAYLPASIPAFERRAGFATQGAAQRIRFKALLRIPAFWILSFATGSMIGVNSAVMISMVPYAIDRGFDTMDAALLVSILGGGAFIGKILFGVVADRIDLRWALRLGLLVMASGLVLLFFSGTYSAAAVAAVIFGFGLGGMIPVWGAVVAHVFGLATCGSAMGFTRAAMTPLAAGCPLIAGLTVDYTGHYDGVWITFSALLLIAFGVTFLAGNWTRPAASTVPQRI